MTEKEPVPGRVTPRPTAAAIVRLWGASLGRRLPPGRPAPGLRHSAATRQLVLVLAGTEVVTAFVISSMLPPALRVVHAVTELLMILAGLGLVASLLRHPHMVDDAHVVLRTGFLGEVALPRAAVRSAAPVVRTVPGRGPRPVPGEPGAVACSVEAAVNVALHLDPPVRLDLGRAGRVDAATVYLSADSPSAFAAALSVSLRARSAPGR
ncbi:hypothetical protein GCM10010302_29040 [Streptomyces polychromogenes]|uniref:Integral membrane protein n=1 Tax=Streptomyces polychromogenes TaxID=67342 RepID=A0ABN0VCW4_9ACTN